MKNDIMSNLFNVNNKKNHVVYIFVILVIMGLFFYMLNNNVGVRSDDIYYQYQYLPNNIYNLPQPINPNKKITNLSEIFLSQINHYQSMNGRFVVHFIVQFFCSIAGKPLFNIITSIVFILYMFVLCKISGINLFSNLSIWIIALSFFWLLMPYPSCLSLNIAFGVNYLWAPFLCISFLCLYRCKKLVDNAWMCILLFIFGFLAGESHEGFTIGIAGFLFLDLLINFKKMDKIKILMSLGFMLGCFLLITSPSNFHQFLGTTQQQDSFISNRLFVFERLRRFWVVIVGLVCLFVINKKRFRLIVTSNKDIMLILIIQLIFSLIIGSRRERALFGVELYSLILLVMIVNSFLLSRYRLSFITSIFSFILLIFLNYGILKTSFMVKKEYDYMINIYLSNPQGITYYQNLEINKYYGSYVNRFSSPQWEYDAISFYYKKKFVVK